MAKKRIKNTKEPPVGLFYIPGFLTIEDENALLEYISAEPFKPYDYHGYLAKREIVFYGSQGGYKGRDATGIVAIPQWLEPLRQRCANLVGLAADELEMALVAHYPVGAAIGWHRDAPQFGPTVLGVSFASDAQMRFRRFVDDTEEMFRINLEHGSAYIMSGPARSQWQHGMTPVKQLRYSITFRTVKASAKQKGTDPRHLPENIANRLASLQVPVVDGSVSVPAMKQLSLF
jgi:alkylated DNA repair protein (DNA oxidative demethylase)